MPSQSIRDGNNEKDFENALKNGQNVILYNHGNAGSRATGHRVEIYKFLRKFFHVITFDYRGMSGLGTSSRNIWTDIFHGLKCV